MSFTDAEGSLCTDRWGPGCDCPEPPEGCSPICIRVRGECGHYASGHCRDPLYVLENFVAGATVTVRGPSPAATVVFTGTTDAAGLVCFPVPVAGTYSAEISPPGPGLLPVTLTFYASCGFVSADPEDT
jgi:hypothetical protein